MRRYRIDCLDAAGQVSQRFIIFCQDDDAAVRLAGKFHHPHAVEIHLSDAMCARLEGERPARLQ